MDTQFTEKKLIEVYVELDDLLKEFEKYSLKKGTPLKKHDTVLSASEVGAILVMYHLSGYKTFEYYYKRVILKEYKSWFPQAPNYKSFLRYISMSLEVMILWLLYKCSQSKRTGFYIIDSKKLPVCHIKREHQHQVFKDIARKGKSSMGWFYGFKIHLVINNLGEVVSFELSTGNVADNNPDLLKKLLSKLEGICIGDKGYLTKLFEYFYENKLHLLVKQKKNSQGKVVLPHHIKLLNSRGLIESVFDIASSIMDIDHTRHRKPVNAFTHIFSAIVAYQFYENKPCLFFPSLLEQNISNAA